jgi:hypothetical protein
MNSILERRIADLQLCNLSRKEAEAQAKQENKIITSYVCPPIPVRCMDWQATYEGYDEGDPIGNGATEQEAIDDLKGAK